MTELITQLQEIVGTKNIITDPADMAPYCDDWRGNYTGITPAVLLPTSTEMVADLLAFADKHNVTIVPQGGNTGLVGGGVPDKSGTMIIYHYAG